MARSGMRQSAEDLVPGPVDGNRAPWQLTGSIEQSSCDQGRTVTSEQGELRRVLTPIGVSPA